MPTEVPNSLRERLRALPVFTGDKPAFEPDAAPEDPVSLFLDWLDQAIAGGVPAPHAMTLSTSGGGDTSSRVLILKDVDADGWQFATDSGSPKARDISEHPSVALNFFWPALARQVRATGAAIPLPCGASQADFLARPEGSRAATLVGHQSEPLNNREEYTAAFQESLARVRRDPDLAPSSWTVYSVRPDTVEFWQATDDRAHTRLQYRRDGNGWTRQLLWP